MKKIILLMSLAIAGISCDDDIRDDHNFTTSPKIVGFSNPLSTVSYFADTGAVERTFPLSLIGGGDGKPLAVDTQVSYTIDAASTATEGVEFDFVNNNGKIVIPAGQTFGNFPILVNTGDLNPTQKTELILNLTAVNNGAVVSANHKQLRIIFVGCQSQVAGTYVVTVTRNDGVVRVYTPEIISSPAVNDFKTSTTGQWAAGSIAPDTGYNFTDICGDITMPDQNLAQGFYSNTVIGTDFYPGANDGKVYSLNNFQTKYEISFAAGNRQYTNNYVR